MRARSRRPARREALPACLRGFFWDCDFRQLRWATDREFIIGRVLAVGDWDTIRWLRRREGDPALGAWIEARRGRGLDPRRLRLFEVVLDLPHDRVNAWLRRMKQDVWARRTAR